VPYSRKDAKEPSRKAALPKGLIPAGALVNKFGTRRLLIGIDLSFSPGFNRAIKIARMLLEPFQRFLIPCQQLKPLKRLKRIMMAPYSPG
jgi:hypothetical protein